MTKASYPKISFRVPPSLHESLLSISRQQGVSLSKLIKDTLSQCLNPLLIGAIFSGQEMDKSTLNNFVGQNQKEYCECPAQTAPSLEV